MPRYYFHLRNTHDLVLDPDGKEFSVRSQINDEAIREARAIISADVLEGFVDLDQKIEVYDENELLICSIPFSRAVRISGSDSDGS